MNVLRSGPPSAILAYTARTPSPARTRTAEDNPNQP
ncbi:Uncharacterised protein [Mycobacterium tuberculosis]|uniref:Uncharacterized protein n=1 Tax=Mycobacterium tuberculosis TaxID=1773 RepID=A0A0U0T8N6_MYCTX|nr:Uncharacterised protein [Mycobacterium tuberculosis]